MFRKRQEKVTKKLSKVLTRVVNIDIITTVVKRKWRNWQTRRTKDPVTALGREVQVLFPMGRVTSHMTGFFVLKSKRLQIVEKLVF